MQLESELTAPQSANQVCEMPQKRMILLKKETCILFCTSLAFIYILKSLYFLNINICVGFCFQTRFFFSSFNLLHGE